MEINNSWHVHRICPFYKHIFTFSPVCKTCKCTMNKTGTNASIRQEIYRKTRSSQTGEQATKTTTPKPDSRMRERERENSKCAAFVTRHAMCNSLNCAICMTIIAFVYIFRIPNVATVIFRFPFSSSFHRRVVCGGLK